VDCFYKHHLRMAPISDFVSGAELLTLGLIF